MQLPQLLDFRIVGLRYSEKAARKRWVEVCGGGGVIASAGGFGIVGHCTATGCTVGCTVPDCDAHALSASRHSGAIPLIDLFTVFALLRKLGLGGVRRLLHGGLFGDGFRSGLLGRRGDGAGIDSALFAVARVRGFLVGQARRVVEHVHRACADRDTQGTDAGDEIGAHTITIPPAR
ncbi:hypothetical protein [Chitinasiproducens palmae]|uniref:hypothetical protein n=1 Tax=Chitinasiproducens palmae TaxID=1770053 RepID=UPI00147AB128|nr:hypothetical protein [Chitinasiproducens palmae]